MGRSIYFTDLEIEKLIEYVSNSVELLGEAENNIKAEEAKRFMQNTRRKEGKVRDKISETFIFQFPKEEEAEDE